eukprot:3114726-Pyramimonas_sp.AAC.1
MRPPRKPNEALRGPKTAPQEASKLHPRARRETCFSLAAPAAAGRRRPMGLGVQGLLDVRFGVSWEVSCHAFGSCFEAS